MADPVQITIFPEGLPEGLSRGGNGSEGKGLGLRGGQKVEGKVEVKALKDIEFGAFRIGFFWHTEGKGNRASGSGGTDELSGEGRWRAGERVTYPFSVSAPWGPLSHDGKLLKVVWSLEARVERSMLHSAITEALPVFLEADPEGRGHDLGPRPQKANELEAVKRGLGALWLTFGLVLTLGGIVLGALRGWDLYGVERWFLFVAMAGGFLLMLKGVWGRLGRGKLGEPSVQLSTTEVRRGEEIRFSLALRPNQRTEVRTLDVILECEERVVHGHGQYQSHHRKTVFEQRLSLAEGLLIEPHRTLRKKGAVNLPGDAPTSFGAPDNQVVWWLRFQADIVGWPDWKEPFLLTVRP
ncbi:MAG: hypothetical protein ACQET1_07030 [Gemmatimonadota bacterium]